MIITAARLTVIAKHDPRMMSVTAVSGRINFPSRSIKKVSLLEIMVNMPLIAELVATSLAELIRLQNSRRLIWRKL